MGSKTRFVVGVDYQKVTRTHFNKRIFRSRTYGSSAPKQLERGLIIFLQAVLPVPEKPIFRLIKVWKILLKRSK